MRFHARMSLVAIGAALALGGCGSGTPQPLGDTQGSPAESQRVSHLPLTVPPEINLRPGSPAAQGDTAAEPASTPGADDGSGTAQSAGEVALLQNAGAAGINPGIRSQIDTETAAQVERDPDLISRLVVPGAAAPAGGSSIVTIRKKGIF